MPTKKTRGVTRLSQQAARRVTPKKTDALRRLSMQIAVQLPESVADAHIVLQLVKDLLDKFLVETRKTPPRR